MTIKKLWLEDTKVADLEPLRGMALRELVISRTKVTDLRPIEGMPLDWLHLRGTSVKDLSVLRGMPLVNLWLNDCTELTDLSPLAEAKKLTRLFLPPNPKSIEFLRALPKLISIDFSQNSVRDKTAAEFWREYDTQSWANALRASGTKINVLKLLPDGTWEVDIPDPKFSDLSLLRGAPISNLRIAQSAVTDLTPLRGMAIKKLYLFDTKVTDLSPLQGMPLELLNLARTKITDFSPVRGLPLKHLCLDSTRVADLRPFEELPLTTLRLHGCPELTDLSLLVKFKDLTNLTLPPNAKDLGILRVLPKLERIGFADDPKNSYLPDKTATEFWKEYDAKKK